MISGCSSQFNCIKSEVEKNDERNKKSKQNNTHIYISKKINNKKYFWKIKRNINFNQKENNLENNKININEDNNKNQNNKKK